MLVGMDVGMVLARPRLAWRLLFGDVNSFIRYFVMPFLMCALVVGGITNVLGCAWEYAPAQSCVRFTLQRWAQWWPPPPRGIHARLLIAMDALLQSCRALFRALSLYWSCCLCPWANRRWRARGVLLSAVLYRGKWIENGDGATERSLTTNEHQVVRVGYIRDTINVGADRVRTWGRLCARLFILAGGAMSYEKAMNARGFPSSGRTNR